MQSVLTRPLGFIDGRWQAARSGRTVPVINPANGEHLGDVPDMGPEDATAAIQAAAAALGTPVPLPQRREWLAAIAHLLIDNKTELARIITLEQGKPLKESADEVDYAAGFFRFYSRHTDRLRPSTAAENVKHARWVVHHRPAGVVGLITPWNFPLAMLSKKLAAAIAAGCGIVTKPAIQTPLTTIALWGLLGELNLPRGLANLVIGKAGPIGDVLCRHPLVRLISFTGSTEVGKVLMAKVAPHVQRLALELGGNAPFIVFDDADIDAAADALMVSKFRCAGQTCVCANRVFVHTAVAQAFTDAVVARTARLRVGPGTDPETDIGPLINRAGYEKVDRHVRDALAKGAKRAFGHDLAPPQQDWGCYYAPTVLTGVTSDMLVSREETFGPVVAITTFDDDADVIAEANSTPYGLASYIFTRDRIRAEGVAAALQFGYVGWNTGTGPTPEAPFGGMKESGFGREGGLDGLFEFTETQTIAESM